MAEVKVCDTWTLCLHSKLEQVADAERQHWHALLELSDRATSSAPTKKFLKAAAPIVEAMQASFALSMVEILDSIGQSFSFNVASQHGIDWSLESATLVHPQYANRLRGLIWSTNLVSNPDLFSALGRAADRSFQKVPGIGPRAPKIGNACLWVFAHADDFEVVAQLNRLLGRVKHTSTRKQIERALTKAAQHHGISRGDLDDMAVPSCGLTEIGARTTVFGDFTGELRIQSTTQVETQWHAPSGKTRKTVPKSVRDAFALKLKEFKTATKQVKDVLAGQRKRLEDAYLHPREWTMEDWLDRLIDHPILGWMSRRLIWSLDDGSSVVSAMWHDDGLVNARGQAIEGLSPDSRVTLWHPIQDDAETVLAWRRWLQEQQLTQPFKQAHREIYLLTDAERRTATYSNRFAAHILKQYQFRALCHARDWQYDFRGNWDSESTPTRSVDDCEVRVEFWVDAAGDEVSAAGIYLYLSTDQVRFYRTSTGNQPAPGWRATAGPPVSLDELDPVLFSELMRDVDLFVGVASVGNDPTWSDGGPEGHFADYWSSFSFGELSATAKTRREILERLIPKLKIADRCSFDERFLIVRGEIRTYKIHLGSANILMAPNDEYLCIVPESMQQDTDVFLPFEGDSRLSVILSKAMMLAADQQISDPTIVSQIR